MTLVSGIGVGKTFGTQLCFRDAKFSISEGTRAGLIGSNGTGKTTLLHIIRRAIDYAGIVSRRKEPFTITKEAMTPTRKSRRISTTVATSFFITVPANPENEINNDGAWELESTA